MFLTCRTVNGIYALLTLIGVGIVISAMPHISLSDIAFPLIPCLFYVADIIFRKKNSSRDMVFTIVWVLWFLYGVINGLAIQDLSPDQSQMSQQTAAVASLVACIGFGVPLLVNGIYLLQLVLRRRHAS